MPLGVDVQAKRRVALDATVLSNRIHRTQVRSPFEDVDSVIPRYTTRRKATWYILYTANTPNDSSMTETRVGSPIPTPC